MVSLGPLLPFQLTFSLSKVDTANWILPVIHEQNILQGRSLWRNGCDRCRKANHGRYREGNLADAPRGGWPFWRRPSEGEILRYLWLNFKRKDSSIFYADVALVGNSHVREGRCSKRVDGKDWFFPFHPILSQRLLKLSDLLCHDLRWFQGDDSAEWSMEFRNNLFSYGVYTTPSDFFKPSDDCSIVSGGIFPKAALLGIFLFSVSLMGGHPFPSCSRAA